MKDPTPEYAYASLPDDRPAKVRIWSCGREWHVAGTTVAAGPRPDGGEMVADISRFSLGDSVRVLIGDGMDYRATIGGKP